MSASYFTKVLLLYALAVLALPFPAGAGEAGRPKRILVLYSYNHPLPANLEIDRGLRAGWRAAGDRAAEWDTEYLDLARFGDPGYLDLIRDLLRRKYDQGHYR